MAPSVPSRLLRALLCALALALTLLLPTAAYAVDSTVSGSVSDPDLEALPGAKVDLIPAGDRDGAAVLSTTTNADGEFEIAPAPDGSYWVRFALSGYETAFLVDADDAPATVIVSGGAVTVPALEVEDGDSLPDVTMLRPAPSVKTPPRLSGQVAVGETVTVSQGTWTGVKLEPDFLTVDWFLDGDDANNFSDGDWSQKFDIPKSAAGKKLTFTVTVDDGQHAPASYTGNGGVVKAADGTTPGQGGGKGTAKATLTGSVVKGKLLVQVTAAGVPNPTGTVTVKDKKTKLGTVTLKAKSKGKGKLTLTLAPGKHKLVLVYSGSSQVKSAKTVVKVTIS
jgi:Big-like domain-containing protein/carboxypeptidase family protein